MSTPPHITTDSTLDNVEAMSYISMLEIVSVNTRIKLPQGSIDGALVVDEDSRRLDCWSGEPGGSLVVATQELAGELSSPPTVIPPGIRLKYFHWLNAHR